MEVVTDAVEKGVKNLQLLVEWMGVAFPTADLARKGMGGRNVELSCSSSEDSPSKGLLDLDLLELVIVIVLSLPSFWLLGGGCHCFLVGSLHFDFSGCLMDNGRLKIVPSLREREVNDGLWTLFPSMNAVTDSLLHFFQVL